MTPLSDAAATRPAEPALFARLIHDAATFPPRSAAVPDAVREHRVHRSSWYAGLLGPVVVPSSAVVELVRCADQDSQPLPVALVVPPATPGAAVTDALQLLAGQERIDVAGVETGWSPGWRDLAVGGVPLSLEVPRVEDRETVIADLARDAGDSAQVQAKLRVGSTPAWDWPDERELAAFIRTAIDHDLGFSLTGGLQHAVRGRYAGEEQHGLLNVLCAVRWALNGEEAHELVPLLQERDAAVLVPMVTRMSAADAAIVRAFFTGYGCGEVTGPVGELAGLGLVVVGR
jgi:hypothetical protein